MAGITIEIDDVNIEIDDYVSLSKVDALGGDISLVDISCDTLGDITVEIAGYIVGEDDYNLLQTLELIDPTQHEE